MRMVSVRSKSKVFDQSKHSNIDYSTLEEVLADIELLTHENFLQSQAAEVAERYLRKKSPNVLIGQDRPLDHLSARGSVLTRRSITLSCSRSRDSASPAMTLTRTSTTSSSPGLTSRSVLHSSAATHRVNIIYRVEMVERELEEGKMNMDKLRKRFESAKFLLQTEEENFKAELEALEEFKQSLENFITENTDPKTGRVFHDKFLRFLENELQLKDRELRKMKLKTKTFQTEYNRIKSQQQQKIELRERLHPVDIDKLHIENQEQLQILEQKTKQLVDLKRTVGRKGQNLISLKSKLNDTMRSLKNITQDTKQKEAKYNFTETKEAKNMHDLIAAEVLNHSMKRLNHSFRSPDVHSYLRMEVALSELQKEQETWERRCRNHRQTLALLEHQLKQLAPSESKMRSNRSIATRSKFSSRSADSLLQPSRLKTPYPHCTPTSPL